MDYEKLMAKARRTNAKRDEAERKAGFATPCEGRLSVQIGTVMSAIEAGVKVNSWGCIAESQAMLEKIVERIEALERELAGRTSGGIYTKRKMKPEEVFEQMINVFVDDSYYLIEPDTDES